MTFQTYLSDRGIPLVCHEPAARTDGGVITIENYCKWYDLFLIKNGIVSKIQSFENDIDWVDHVPVPQSVAAYAARSGYDVDAQSMEMIVGRYLLETRQIDPESIGPELHYHI